MLPRITSLRRYSYLTTAVSLALHSALIVPGSDLQCQAWRSAISCAPLSNVSLLILDAAQNHFIEAVLSPDNSGQPGPAFSTDRPWQRLVMPRLALGDVLRALKICRRYLRGVCISSHLHSGILDTWRQH